MSPTENPASSLASPSASESLPLTPVNNDNKAGSVEISSKEHNQNQTAQTAQLLDLDQPSGKTEEVLNKLDQVQQQQNNQSESENLVKLDVEVKASNNQSIPLDEAALSSKPCIVEATESSDLVKLDDDNDKAVLETDSALIPSLVKLDIDGESETGLQDEMTSSFSKPRITTEEEAKAALAERRRLAREEAERRAEQERLEKEEAERLERERQQREEEQQSLLIQQMKEAEEKRLLDAIQETQRREEEEKQKQLEEQRLKLLKGEAEEKARILAEKQKAELQERLKNEEKEREARRKRVEAIMLRTRGKNNGSQPQVNNFVHNLIICMACSS